MKKTSEQKKICKYLKINRTGTGNLYIIGDNAWRLLIQPTGKNI